MSPCHDVLRSYSRDDLVVDKRTGMEKTGTIERHRARYRDEVGKEHARHFIQKAQAQQWLDQVTT